MKTRLMFVGAISIALVGLGAWYLSDSKYWLGGFLIAAGAALPISQVFAHRSRKRPEYGFFWLALQPAIVTALGLVLGICEIVGIGFRQNVGRGVVTLLGVAFLLRGLQVMKRSWRSSGGSIGGGED